MGEEHQREPVARAAEEQRRGEPSPRPGHTEREGSGRDHEHDLQRRVGERHVDHPGKALGRPVREGGQHRQEDHAQVHRQRPALDDPSDLAGPGEQAVVDRGVRARGHHRPCVGAARPAAEHLGHHDPDHPGRGRDPEGQPEPRPQHEVLLPRARIQRRRHVGERVSDRPGQRPQHDRQRGEHCRCRHEAESGAMHPFGVDRSRDRARTGACWSGRPPHEHPVEEPRGVRHGQRAPHDDHHERDRADEADLEVEEPVEAGFLRDEPERRDDGRHRQRGRTRNHGQGRQEAPQTAQPPQIPGVRLMIDDPHRHEQRRLEQRVGEDQRDAGVGGGRIPDADEDHHQPELAHGAVRQRELRVLLAQRPHPAEEHRRSPGRDDQHSPRAHVGERRREARHHHDPRLHHRGRVEVGAHRRRRRHRARQPEVERELGRLRERPDQHQDERDVHDGARRRIGNERRDRRHARLLPEEHQARPGAPGHPARSPAAPAAQPFARHSFDRRSR